MAGRHKRSNRTGEVHQVLCRLDQDVYEEIAVIAQEDRRSISGMVEILVNESLARRRDREI